MSKYTIHTKLALIFLCVRNDIIVDILLENAGIYMGDGCSQISPFEVTVKLRVLSASYHLI